MTRRRLGAFICSVFAIGAAGAVVAPYLYAEWLLRSPHDLVSPMPMTAVPGRWIDDYYVVQDMGAGVLAIGEPRYYQANYSYLILGSRRAILFDAGTGTRDIVPVVRSLTRMPVTVIASHLHFDHVGALGRLDRTALIDDRALRRRVVDSRLTLHRYEFLGFGDGLQCPSFRVDEWWLPDSVIDLGDRQLRVLAVPGHTPTSVALLDAERGQLFVGDFIYPGRLYAHLPGASRDAYLATVRRLNRIVKPGTSVYAAHMAEPPLPAGAPVLQAADLQALQSTLERIDAGTIRSTGGYPRVFPVRGAVTFATGFSWNNR